MYGFSIFFNEDITDSVKKYIREMHSIGFQGIFSSIHIPEDNPDFYLDRLGQLGAVAQEYGMELTIDVSGNALEKLGISYEDLSPLLELGVTAIRVDYEVTHEEMHQISQQMKLVLNASTLTDEDFNILDSLGVDFSSVEAWHNYYPRPETGLDKHYFIQLNQGLKARGIKVMAFVSGSGDLRGPLYEGLPTLEAHRYANSLASAIELRAECFVDTVYIGDPGIDSYSKRQWDSYLNDSVIYFEALALIDDDQQLDHVQNTHTQRIDLSRDIIRSQESRGRRYFKVKVQNTVERPLGTITIDNHAYTRYEGEVQITKVDLLANDKVNVVGRIQSEDLALLNYIQSGQVFNIKWK